MMILGRFILLVLLFAALPVRSAQVSVLGPEVQRWLPTSGLVGGSSFDGKMTAFGEQSVAGRIGQGFRIDEGEAYALRGRQDEPVGDWDGEQAFSLSLWVKLDADATGLKALVARKEGGDSAQGWGLFAYAGAGVIMMELGDGRNAHFIRCMAEGRRSMRGQWHQVVVTYDGSKKSAGISIYIDGERQGVESKGGDLAQFIRVSGDTLVGSRQGGKEKATQTTVDEVRVFDRVLQDIEIARLAHLVPGRAVGKAARVRVTVATGVLMLAEVEAFVGAFNVAGSGQASQASTYKGEAVAARAIDGNRDGKYGSGSVSHTVGGVDQWWQVELAFPAAIERLILWNREDNRLLADRLSDAKIEVFDEAGNILWSGAVAQPALRENRFDVGLVDLEALRP